VQNLTTGGEEVNRNSTLNPLDQISLSIQNCNALSLRCTDEIFHEKITAICSCGSSIIFLSDVRLLDKNLELKIQKALDANSSKKYQFIANTSKNSRGTAILILRKLEYEQIDIYRDEEENILGLRCRIHGTETAK